MTTMKWGLMGLAILCMAPNRRPFDHIGNFNFRVEPGAADGTTSNFSAELETSTLQCFSTETDAVLLRLTAPLTPAQLTALGSASQIKVVDSDQAVLFKGADLEEYVPNSTIGPAALVSYQTCE